MVRITDDTLLRRDKTVSVFSIETLKQCRKKGDAANDIEMIKKYGIGVAMENAVDEVKAIADEVCPDCDNDGVAKWLAEHMLKSFFTFN